MQPGRECAAYNEKDAAKETESTIKEVAESWHDARDHAAAEGGWGVPADRHGDTQQGESTPPTPEQKSGQ